MLKSTFLFIILQTLLILPGSQSAYANPKTANKIYKKDGLISVYTPLGIEFTFKHAVKEYIPNKVSFFDIWHLWEAYEFSNGERRQKVIQRGEWETAIKLKTGFVGGELHGFEKKKSIRFILDGRSIDEQDNIPISTFEKFTIIQVSDLYAFNNTTEKIAEITKRWTIDRTDEIKLKQEVTWLKEQSIEAAYLTMFPVMRENNGKYITTKASRDDIKKIEDVSQSGELSFIGAKNKTSKSNSIKVWGDTYTFAVAVKRYKRLMNSSIWLWAAKQYNKIYFDYCGEHTAKPGEKFEISSSFKFSKK